MLSVCHRWGRRRRVRRRRREKRKSVKVTSYRGMLVALSLSLSPPPTHSFTHSCTSAIRDPPWSMIQSPSNALGVSGCLREWVSECDMGQGSSWWCDGGDDVDVEEDEGRQRHWRCMGEREREHESSSWWMDGWMDGSLVSHHHHHHHHCHHHHL